VVLLIVSIGLMVGVSILMFCMAWIKKNTYQVSTETSGNWLTYTNSINPALLVVFPKDVWEQTDKKITWAGLEFSPLDFLATKIACGIFMPILLGFVGFSIGIDFYYFIVIAVLGYILPDVYLNRKVEQRQKSIRKYLYEFELLLLTVVVAGMEIMEALRIVGERFGGEIQKEIEITWGQMNTGIRRAEALKNMANRVGIDELNQLIDSIIQAETYGTKISDIIEVHVKQMRTDRTLSIQKKSEEIKVKILGPIIIWFFLPFMIMIFYPLFTQLTKLMN